MPGIYSVKVLWIAIALELGLLGCGPGEARLSTLTLVGAEENLPCLGVRRFRVTVFEDMVHGRSAESFGEFYQQDGSCNLPVGLPVEVSNLPYTATMWIRVEGFDSSQDRRMCLGTTEIFSPGDVKTGDLGSLTLRRRPIVVNDQPSYPTATVVISSLPGIETVGTIDNLTFVINPSLEEPYKVGGSFVPEPELNWSEMKLVLSGLLPGTGNALLVVAYYQTSSIGQWRANPFDINVGDMFIEVAMAKE